MASTLPTSREQSHSATQTESRAVVPAWIMSLVLHAALFITLSIVLKVTPRGTGLEVERAVGIVLRHTSTENPEEAYYEEQGDNSQADTATEAANQSNPLDDAAASAAQATAPSAADVLGPGANSLGSNLSGASGLMSGGAGLRGPLGGQARTQIFGIPAEGYKFVYVFDRSGSMGGQGSTALNRAKAELLASLESLGETHQFQIIFYNEHPTIFNLAGQPRRLVFGNHPNKAQAQKFIHGIVADGGTEHEPALLAALALSPDVIFFLTDADQPELTPTQLRKIADRNRRGTAINTIEFGAGPPLGENFLSRLAAQNGGQYRYVDISKR
jgi:hypothetical protein